MLQALTPSSTTPLAAYADISLTRRILAILIGSWALAASAHIAVPMYPVPVSMQTLAVIVIGATAGWRLSAQIVTAYLLQGAAGLPFFANGASGLAYMSGTTGGFLAGFLLSAVAIGYLADRGWNRRFALLCLSMAVGHTLVFIPGVLWLSTFIGIEGAVTHGFMPFIYGSILKIALGIAIVWGSLKGLERRAAL